LYVKMGTLLLEVRWSVIHQLLLCSRPALDPSHPLRPTNEISDTAIVLLGNVSANDISHGTLVLLGRPAGDADVPKVCRIGPELLRA